MTSRLLARRALAFGIIVTSAVQADDTADLAQALIKLRGDVEALNNELDLTREEQRTTLAALTQQRAELDAQLTRQHTLTRELREKQAQRAEQAAAAGVNADTLKPTLLTAIDNLRDVVARGLPFKIEERMAALDEIRTQLENGALPAHRAANRLWAYFEDEFRITRETGLHKQTVALGKETVLADVAKVGSVLLYFKTQDGRLGYARREQNGWRFLATDDAIDKAQIAQLFDALNKQIRQGYFELPMTLGVAGG
jgi:hypothetical protein